MGFTHKDLDPDLLVTIDGGDNSALGSAGCKHGSGGVGSNSHACGTCYKECPSHANGV